MQKILSLLVRVLCIAGAYGVIPRIQEVGGIQKGKQAPASSKPSAVKQLLHQRPVSPSPVKQEPEPSFIPNDDQSVINLEHVLPEKPQDNWPQFIPEVAASFYKRIGNMALLQARSNSDIRSANFGEKRKSYRASPFELTRQIADLEEWTPCEVSE